MKVLKILGRIGDILLFLLFYLLPVWVFLVLVAFHVFKNKLWLWAILFGMAQIFLLFCYILFAIDKDEKEKISDKQK
jgi:hypothetical protein